MKLEEHFKPFRLGMCNCGCNESIPIRNTQGQLARYKHGHNPTSDPPHFRGPKHYHWKGGRNIDKDGYIQIYKPEHPFAGPSGYVLEHRLVMEQHIGRYLERHEIVHHKNRNRQDNRIENLELISSLSEHRKLHGEEDRNDRQCGICGSDKTRSTNGIFRWRRHNNIWYCSKCDDKFYKKQKKHKYCG